MQLLRTLTVPNSEENVNDISKGEFRIAKALGFGKSKAICLYAEWI